MNRQVYPAISHHCMVFLLWQVMSRNIAVTPRSFYWVSRRLEGQSIWGWQQPPSHRTLTTHNKWFLGKGGQGWKHTSCFFEFGYSDTLFSISPFESFWPIMMSWCSLQKDRLESSRKSQVSSFFHIPFRYLVVRCSYGWCYQLGMLRGAACGWRGVAEHSKKVAWLFPIWWNFCRWNEVVLILLPKWTDALGVFNFAGLWWKSMNLYLFIDIFWSSILYHCCYTPEN